MAPRENSNRWQASHLPIHRFGIDKLAVHQPGSRGFRISTGSWDRREAGGSNPPSRPRHRPGQSVSATLTDSRTVS